MKKIKIIRDDNVSINGIIENKYGTKCSLSATDRIIIEKLNEIIERLNDLGK